jgi:hypothetical protein
VRYDYLWRREAQNGLGSSKDRSACLIAASDASAKPRFVVLLPITHSPPQPETVGIEIPAKVRAATGLDNAPCWVIVSEHNVDEWPNGGLSHVPGREDFAYGFVPPGLLAIIKAAFLELARARKSAAVRR